MKILLIRDKVTNEIVRHIAIKEDTYIEQTTEKFKEFPTVKLELVDLDKNDVLKYFYERTTELDVYQGYDNLNIIKGVLQSIMERIGVQVEGIEKKLELQGIALKQLLEVTPIEH